MTEFHFLENADALDSLAKAVRDAPWVGIDTEFMRERTYRPKLCLLQLSLPGQIACVDPLALPLGPLFAALAGPALKIGHALRQDLEILRQEGGGVPIPVFDTQVAAALLGYDDQVGYAALCAEELGVVLDKTATRTDWAVRPLSPEQLQYAANDVVHLEPLRAALAGRLAQRGRTQWLLEDCARLAEQARKSEGLEQAQARLDHVHKLPVPVQKALAGLLAWREQRASERDRPRQWIVPDDALLRVATRLADTPSAVRATPGLTPPVLRHADALAQAVQAGREDPLPPPWRPRAVLNPDEQERLDRALVLVRQHAALLGIEASWLAPRRLVEQWVRGHQTLQGWRRAELEGILSDVLKSSAA